MINKLPIKSTEFLEQNDQIDSKHIPVLFIAIDPFTNKIDKNDALNFTKRIEQQIPRCNKFFSITKSIAYNR